MRRIACFRCYPIQGQQARNNEGENPIKSIACRMGMAINKNDNVQAEGANN